MYRNTFHDNGVGAFIHLGANTEAGMYNEYFDNVFEDNCFGLFHWASNDLNIRLRGSNRFEENELMGVSFMRASYLAAGIGTSNDYVPVDWQCNTCPLRDDFPDETIEFTAGVEREGALDCSFEQGTVIRDNDMMVAGQVHFWGPNCPFDIEGALSWSTYFDRPEAVEGDDGPVEAACHPGDEADYYFDVSANPLADHGITDASVSPFVFQRCGGGSILFARQDLEIGDDVELRMTCRDWNPTYCVMEGDESGNACTEAHPKYGRCCPAGDVECQELRDGDCGEERWPICCYCQPQDEECEEARYLDLGMHCCEPADAACRATHPDYPECANIVISCCDPDDLSCQARHPDYELCCDAEDESCEGHVVTCQ